MDNTNPLVSLFVICYNHEKFVRQALECARNQTYPNIELIILDDCSTDQSVSVIDQWIAEHNVKCMFIKHTQNVGVVKSLNECLKISTGAYISFFAADDLITPNKTQQLLTVLNDSSVEVCLAHGDLDVIDENGKVIYDSFYAWYHEGLPMPSGYIFEYYLTKNAVHMQGALIKKEVYVALGSYDESLLYEDWDMGMRMARSYSFLYVPGLIGSHRKFQGQMTDVFWNDRRFHSKILASDFKMYSKHLDLIQYRSELLKILNRIFYQQTQLRYLTWGEKISSSHFLIKQRLSVPSLLIFLSTLLNQSSLMIRIIRKLSKMSVK